jgi:hypothetical protein
LFDQFHCLKQFGDAFREVKSPPVKLAQDEINPVHDRMLQQMRQKIVLGALHIHLDHDARLRRGFVDQISREINRGSLAPARRRLVSRQLDHGR